MAIAGYAERRAQEAQLIRIPAEWESHACCWMAWAVHEEWRDWIGAVKEELASVIQSIAGFEPVRLLTPRQEIVDARARFSGGNVEIIEAPVDDIWMRDIVPTFALRGEEVVAIDWHFNGWGNPRERPARPGDKFAKIAESIFNVPHISSPVVAEGGALITDGEGTLITTRSCLLNPNRNPVLGHEPRELGIEHKLARFGIERTIWLEGDPCEPGTSGHVDGYVMFTAPGRVLVETVDGEVAPPFWREHDIVLLERARDAAGRRLKVERVLGPRKRYWRFRGPSWAPCYVNAYVANGAVITARFGDAERDETAKDALERAFPGREIIMLKIDHIANGGGGIHCLTQPMPSKPATKFRVQLN